jgi:glycosyltransferase involved in cell wall biosynthesis
MQFYGTSPLRRSGYSAIRATISRMKLSVMMVTHNHERFIAQALDSILAQRVNFDYEIVVAEDCSTDSTREILMDFHRRYPRRIVPLLRQHNLGVLRNFGSAITSCAGQYMAFLEGDDYWTCADKLQRQVDFLDTHPDFAICCHRVRFLEETASAQPDLFPSRPAGAYTLEDLLRGNFVMTCSTVLRRNLIPSLPRWFFKMKLGDWPLFALVAQHGKIELMDGVMAVYRVHSGSSWSSLPPATRLRESAKMLRALDKHLGFQHSKVIRNTIAHPYLELALSARLNGNRTQTGKHLVSCLRNGGWQLPGNRRPLAGLAAYVLIGSWYKILSMGIRPIK